MNEEHFKEILMKVLIIQIDTNNKNPRKYIIKEIEKINNVV